MNIYYIYYIIQVVSILCDGGARYASKLYNPEWLAEKGLAEDAAAAAAADAATLSFIG